jgi:hypothetical protein
VMNEVGLSVRFWGLMAASMKMTVFWDIVLYSVVDTD